LFFPEKRDFFLQDAGIFEFGNIDTNGRPFFSRRIGLSQDGEAVGIDGGIKLTGRVGDFNIGALAIRQEAAGDVSAKDLFVARGSYNVLDESAIGFIMTHGDPASNESNSVIGLDFLYRNSDGPFGEILTGRFWAQQSDSSDLDGDDQAFGTRLEIPSDKLLAYVDLQQIEDNFRPALGFVNRAGIRQYDTGMRYRTRPETGFWRAINHRFDYTLVTDMSDRTLSQRLALMPIGLYSNRDDYMSLRWSRQKESVRDGFELFGRLTIDQGEYETGSPDTGARGRRFLRRRPARKTRGIGVAAVRLSVPWSRLHRECCGSAKRQLYLASRKPAFGRCVQLALVLE
jgi:hypothetical protein